MDSLIGEIPDDWHQIRLDECCDLQPGPGGSAITSADRVIGGVPVISARDIQNGRIDPAPAVSVHPATAQRHDRYQLLEGDVLVVRVGGLRHARVDRAHEGWLTGSSCLRIRPQTDDFEPGYLDCYLRHPSVRDWLAQQFRSSIVSTTTPARIAALPVVLPPHRLQRAIIDITDTLHNKIEIHEEIIRTTHALRNLLIPKMLTGHL
ncbi:MAG: restriction endonuclease subunit S [Pseudonocardiaceae bacterium]